MTMVYKIKIPSLLGDVALLNDVCDCQLDGVGNVKQYFNIKVVKPGIAEISNKKKLGLGEKTIIK